MNKLRLLVILSIIFVYTDFVVSDERKFSIQGFHLDLRNEVMKMSSLKELATKLSRGGVNMLIMEWEDTFPYENHPLVSGRYSYSREEIKDFTRHCNSLGIDVVPLQQTFGHVEYILRYDKYAHIREDSRDYSQVCPLNEESSLLFSELIDDMISLSTSKYVHIGCDETRLLGKCSHCNEFVEKHGKSKLFVNYVTKICQQVTDKGKVPVLWGDIILKYPEYAHELPKDAIFVDWNYSDQPKNEKKIAKLQKEGYEFWGAPSLRSSPDNLYITDWIKHFKNQQVYIPFAKENSFNGVIMTSWSTSGTYSYIWDYPSFRVIHLEEVRNVYPLAGFNILIESYLYSLKNNSFSYEDFIRNYAKNHFGFNINESEAFLSMFQIPPYIIVGNKIQGNPRMTISEVYKEFEEIRASIAKLRPKRNKNEFAHLKLMLDIRANHIALKNQEALFNTKNLTSQQVEKIFNVVEVIKKEEDRIDKEFIKLNKESYYIPELIHLNKIRSKEASDLFYKLKQIIINKK